MCIECDCGARHNMRCNCWKKDRADLDYLTNVINETAHNLDFIAYAKVFSDDPIYLRHLVTEFQDQATQALKNIWKARG